MEAKKVKVCTDRSLPLELQAAAAQLAVKENPSNVPAVNFSPGMGVPQLPPPFMALLTAKKWKNGRVLRVRFLDGHPTVQEKVKTYAQQWSEHANITFDFGSDPAAEIRISFRLTGSWSYIGTDALSIPKDRPTMNFGWLKLNTQDDEYSRVVLHEFGHALACIHEHQNPSAGIPWDKEAVYRYYQGPPNNWSRADVDANLFQKYSQTLTQFSQFDRRSIMLYAIPNEFTIGDFEVGWNRVLSETDRSFIGAMYPLESKAMVDLIPGRRAVQAAIGRHGEEDLFRLKPTAAGRYLVETRGSTDVVMTLLGPNNQTRLIAQDDDSGAGFNARIVADLKASTYYVRVRHYRPRGTGSYSISVKQKG